VHRLGFVVRAFGETEGVGGGRGDAGLFELEGVAVALGVLEAPGGFEKIEVVFETVEVGLGLFVLRGEDPKEEGLVVILGRQDLEKRQRVDNSGGLPGLSGDLDEQFLTLAV